MREKRTGLQGGGERDGQLHLSFLNGVANQELHGKLPKCSLLPLNVLEDWIF